MSRRPLVLLVDDEPSILRSTGLLLEDLGFRVHALGEHEGVAEAARQLAPDVILQDVRMPGLDIERLVRALRAQKATAGIPIVLFSASMDLEEIGGRVAVDDVLEKPFHPEQLQAALERALKDA
jgi:CheY-like chemotaxis protein